MARIPIVTDGEKKEEIEEYAENNVKYESVSQLFRAAVNKEMAGEFERDHSPSPEVIKRLERLEAEMREINQELRSLNANLADDSRDTEELAQEVLDAIPVAPTANSAEITNSDMSSDELDEMHARNALSHTDSASTLSGLAQELEVDRSQVKDAIQHLKSNFLPIYEIVGDEGYKHYLKQDERI